MKHSEYKLQAAICRYLSIRYKKTLFLSDTIGNVKLTKIQAYRNKKIQKSGFSCPDIIILEPRGQYHGLFLEIKIKSPFKLNGELYKNAHLEAQQASINDLNSRGYKAMFVWSLDMAINAIDEYMKLKPIFG